MQQVARHEATYPSHARVFISCNKTYPSHARISISCNKLHATRGRIPLMCVFHLPCSVHLDARPIHLIRVFPFRATSCTLQGDGSLSCACFIYPVACILMHDLSTSYACFHFVQRVARYETTYPSHERIFISCNKLHATRRPIPLMCVFHLSCSVHLDARPIPHASVFIRATHCMKCGEWCFNVVYFW